MWCPMCAEGSVGRQPACGLSPGWCHWCGARGVRPKCRHLSVLRCTLDQLPSHSACRCRRCGEHGEVPCGEQACCCRQGGVAGACQEVLWRRGRHSRQLHAATRQPSIREPAPALKTNPGRGAGLERVVGGICCSDGVIPWIWSSAAGDAWGGGLAGVDQMCVAARGSRAPVSRAAAVCAAPPPVHWPTNSALLVAHRWHRVHENCWHMSGGGGCATLRAGLGVPGR